MLTFSGSRRTLCDGLSRRQLLQVGGLELLGLAAQQQTLANSNATLPAFGRAKSCILIFPYGSPSSHETFDPKPSAPAEVQGEMKAISSVVPGLSVCERIPSMATVMDKVTVIRSMTHPYPLHGLAYAVTGIPPIRLPWKHGHGTSSTGPSSDPSSTSSTPPRGAEMQSCHGILDCPGW